MKQNIDYISRATVSPEKIRWLQAHSPSNHGRALDIGCGAGLYSHWLMDRGWEVEAIDINPLRENTRLKIKIGNLEDGLDFPGEHFDFLMAWDILEHLQNEKDAWKEMVRVLRPGGVIMGSVPHGDDERLRKYNLTYKHHIDKTHKREYVLPDIQERMDHSGLVLEKTELVGPISPQILAEFVSIKFLRRPTALAIGAARRMGFLRFEELYSDIFFLGRKKA